MSQRPFLSVIVPAHQAVEFLPRSLGHLVASDLPRHSWELIVVDDASTDPTSLIAAQYADTVVRLPGKARGPAFARNRGYEVSRGDILVFVDADVCVHPDALHRVATAFAAEPHLAALFGSYDPGPGDATVMTQYRNLMRVYAHQCYAGEAETFWAPFGAVRRSAFAEVGPFDEWHYTRPQVEDIEFGRRMRRRGYRIAVRPEIQGTHLKRWSFASALATDFARRGVPWSWLELHEGPGSETGNTRKVERWCTGMVGAALLALAIAGVLRSAWALAAAAALVAAVLVINRGFYRFVFRRRGARLAVVAMPLHLVYYGTNGLSALASRILRFLYGEPQPPPDVEAHAAVGVKTWPPAASRPVGGIWDAAPVATRSQPANSAGGRAMRADPDTANTEPAARGPGK